MKRFVIVLAWLCLSFFTGESYATTGAPEMTLSTHGVHVFVSWTSVPNATGYRLYYAPYPFQGEHTIGNFDMGLQTSFNGDLWAGAAFFVAVRAYDSQGISDYSNIDYFIMGPPTPEWVDDADADGFTEGQGDCNDGNNRIYPGAAEICGDGIDHDCNGKDLDCSDSIWQPSPGTSWQWQLLDRIDTTIDVDMYDVDLFNVTKETINQLHEDGRIVVCYFSAGSSEDWRADFFKFPQAIMGNELTGWAGERWLDVRQIEVVGPIMRDRLDLAVDKGCDGVEPDNVDAHSNDSGFPLSASDQLAYNIWLAREAHSKGLSVGLKNSLDLVRVLEPYFDWALNEQCFQNDECQMLSPFIAAGKAVFGVEYELNPGEFCSKANALNFDWLFKNYDLDSWRISCR